MLSRCSLPVQLVARVVIAVATAHRQWHSLSRMVCTCSVLCCAVLQDKSSDELRAHAAGLLGAMCRSGGAVLWTSAGYYAEDALKAAVAGLEDAATVSRLHAAG